MNTGSCAGKQIKIWKRKRFCFLLLALCGLLPGLPCLAADDGTQLAGAYAQEVNQRLDLSPEEQRRYGDMISQLVVLSSGDPAQYVVIVDRNEFVQAAMIYWMSPERVLTFIGASPVSTGKPGRFDHFKTPLGVFEHTIADADFRSEGTRNKFGIRGYGRKHMRVFDFGWQKGVRGWGHGGESMMRLEMHATDPDFLEKLVGTVQSKGCIRIPASLNVFIDRHAILDGDYDTAMAEGKTFWVLSKTREPTSSSGRFLVVVDTERAARPPWSPEPLKQ